MQAGGNLEMNADDDGWADDLIERWFEEFEDQVDEPSREDQSSRARVTPTS